MTRFFPLSASSFLQPLFYLARALALLPLLPGSLLLHPSCASQPQAHQAGQAFASSLAGTVTGAAQGTSPATVPGFTTPRPPEAGFDAHSLGEQAAAAAKTSPAGQHAVSQAQGRQTFKVDPDTDPLFVTARPALQDPQKALSETFTQTSTASGSREEFKTCLESGEEYQQSCYRDLVIELKITPEIGHRTPRWCILHWKNKYTGSKYNCGGCRGGEYVITQPKSVEVVREEWVGTCTVLEDLVDKGLCRYVSAFSSPKNETRTIQGEPVTRDHFRDDFTYACFKAPPQTSGSSCSSLRARGCVQTQSVCQEKKGGHCMVWKQTYRCASGNPAVKSWRSSNSDNPFCLTGNCADTSYEANTGMLEVMGQLSVLREAQNDLRTYNAIFKGQPRACTRNCLNFRDCCGSGKGWGVSMGLSSCSKEEKELRVLRDKNLCMQVGTYCAERDKVFKSCLRKKTTFCCFGTKLARLLQQGGRNQLGLGWGSPRHPDCSGFSAEQLSQIDFTRLDLSELFEDIKSQMVAKGQQQSLAHVSAERLQDNMTCMTRPSPGLAHQKALKKLKEKGM